MLTCEPVSGGNIATANECTVSRPRYRVCDKSQLQVLMKPMLEGMEGEMAPEQAVSIIARTRSDQIQIAELRRLVLDCR